MQSDLRPRQSLSPQETRLSVFCPASVMFLQQNSSREVREGMPLSSSNPASVISGEQCRSRKVINDKFSQGPLIQQRSIHLRPPHEDLPV